MHISINKYLYDLHNSYNMSDDFQRVDNKLLCENTCMIVSYIIVSHLSI